MPRLGPIRAVGSVTATGSGTPAGRADVPRNPAMTPQHTTRCPDLSLSEVDPGRLRLLWPHASAASAGGPAAVCCPEVVDLAPADFADSLRHQLAAPLDPQPDLGVDDDDAPITLADLLAHPAPPAEPLRRVKDWAKPHMGEHGGELPREVAGVLYFAAVAADRVRGSGRVSELSNDQVAAGAAWALRLPWLDAGAAELFRAAIAKLRPSTPRADPSEPKPIG